MAVPLKLAVRLRPAWAGAPVRVRTFTSTVARSKEDAQWPQAIPLGPYYENILNNPPPYPFEEKPEDPPNSADPEVIPPEKKIDQKEEETATPPPTKKKPGRKPKNSTASATQSQPIPSTQTSATSPPSPSPPPTSAQEKARIIFGSRLLPPAEQAERNALKQNQSTYIAGVLVPPHPEEPDNCCMSGCVNCVWDRYRDEMEEWSAKKNEAQARMMQQESGAASGSVDADGGPAPAPAGVRLGDAKIVKDLWDEEAFQNVPVGIREFMKTEKRLRDRHEREAAGRG